MGDNNIKNPYFKDSKVGNSYNIIECYNVKGDININRMKRLDKTLIN